MKSNIDEGHVILVPEGKEMDEGVRLVWKKSDSSRVRPLDPGTYTVRRYVVEIDGEWAVWASGQGREVKVTKGKRTDLPLDLTPSLRMNLRRQGARLSLGGQFMGDHHMGVSLLKGRRRIDVAWKIVLGDREMASGPCSYG